MIREELPPALDGERLDRIVALVADVSRSAATAIIAAGGARVDGHVAVTGKVRLATGDVVEIDPATIPAATLPVADPAITVEVVHADAAVVVVDKPAGLVVHPGAGHPDGTLVNGLLARFPEIEAVGDRHRPGIVHRLDAGSSGLLVVARTEEARVALMAQFADHSARRRYDAVVWRHPDAAHGIIDAPIGRDPSDPLRMAVVTDGRPARTEYRVVETYDAPAELARLSCTLETGRTHQIRVHLSAVGHPLVGDTVYGDRRPVLGLTRPFLHAAELSVDHPTTGERLSFTSPLPDDLARFLATTE